jgi:hypothetical protein
LLLAACGSEAADTTAASTTGAGGAGGEALGGGGAGGAAYVWPNEASIANSDPWIMQNHAAIREMRPRVLLLNFVNARTNDEMVAQLGGYIEAMREGSRSHGSGEPFLRYEIAYAIDLRDRPPPPGWTYANSTLYPREEPVEGYWGFDYEALFGQTFAGLYGIADPRDPSRTLRLCELVDRGLVHEVWVYGDADVPDVSAAEVLEIKPYYDERRVRVDGPLSRCAGNGCFDAEDELPAECTRSLRIGWFNNTRGPGCFMESLAHGFESTGRDPLLVPTLHRDFVRFARFDLAATEGVPFDSWYACSTPDCLTYPTETSVTWSVNGQSGTIDPFDPVCGNAHFAPNGRQHYDLSSPFTVQSSCRTFGLGDALEPFTSAAFAPYNSIAPDCMGPFLVWWRQSFPGLDTAAVGPAGPMLNWWPYLFY